MTTDHSGAGGAQPQAGSQETGPDSSPWAIPGQPSALLVERAGDLVEQRCAVFDPTRTYRYVLERRWGPGPAAVFVMLNPSTADADVDDATIRRCLRFARREQCRALIVANLFALRSSDPRALYAHPDPIGPHNDVLLMAAIARREGGPLIAAWGAHGVLHGRDVAVAALLAPFAPCCLHLTADGHPGHPLYLRADAPLIAYQPRSAPQDGAPPPRP